MAAVPRTANLAQQARPFGPSGTFLDELVGAFYDTAVAVTDGCAWCAVLPKMCGAFGATAGSFAVHDFSSRRGALRHGFNISRKYREAYNNGLSAADPWIESLAYYEAGSVVLGEDIVPDGSMARATFYKACLEPQDLLHRLCGVITRDGAQAHFVNLLRPPEAPAFDHDDRARLFHLLPHLKRSVEVRDEVVRDRLARDSLAEFMDQLPVAFLLIDGDGHVTLRNRAATEMIARGDGLFLCAGGYLATAGPKSTADLRRLIAATAAGTANGEGSDRGEHFIIPRGAELLPLVGVLYPVRRNAVDGDEHRDPAVAMLIKDPQTETADGLKEFASAYNLTNAEARLFGLLSAGHGLLDAARELGITKNTVRTHMRNIYSKVGTHRQADLIRLLGQFSMF